MLCYELGRDEAEDQLTGEMEAYRDQLENASTLFLGGGSKSGKSTLITHIAAQMAIMGAMFYIIDPHLMHPEKSIAKRLEPLAHAFILPPAMTDADVHMVLQHATKEASARENGKETRLAGRPIVFIADETLNLFGRAQRSSNQEVQHLYRDLALFMRDLGTQYNKFGMNGIFASQYVTKDAFKLPGANIDFRDGCQSQGLLRLPPNQAQAMRLIPSSDLRAMRTLPVGHGYMGFSSGDVIRMAFGNVTRADIEQVGKMVQSTNRVVSPVSPLTVDASVEHEMSYGCESGESGVRVDEEPGESRVRVSPNGERFVRVGESDVRVSPEEYTLILNAAKAQLKEPGRTKVAIQKLINEHNPPMNNRWWDKIRQVLDEEGL